MQSNKTETQTLLLLKSIQSCISNCGIDKTIEVLNELGSGLIFEDQYIQSVVSIVCNSFSIKPIDIVNNRYVRGEQKIAIGFIVYYLYKKYSLGEIHKTVFPSKDKGLLSKYRTIIERLDTRYKNDIPYLEIKKSLDQSVKNIKQNQTL